MRKSFGKRTFVLVAVMMLTLSACGRKGPLEPPPSATAIEAGDSQTDAVEAPRERRTFFLDFLL